MCKCNKGLPANKSPLVSSAFASNNGVFRYSTNDFLVKYYIGESEIYTGSATGIDYGYRTYNTKTMVHTDDYQADGHLFSDTEQELNVRSIEEEKVVEVETFTTEEAEEVPVTRSKKNKIKKEVEDNAENTI